MQLSAVLLARAIGFIETYDLNPKGRVFFPDVVKAIVERYNFQKFPLEFKDFNEQSGVEFFAGRIGNDVIDRLVIYNSGILVDTRSNTKTAQSMVEDALTWAMAKFDLNYRPGMVKRFVYLSQLTFYSEVSLNALSPALQKLADRVTAEVSKILGEKIEYQTTSLAVQHDPLARKNPIAGFTIQPRVDTPFTERKYFSEAGLPTDLHLAILKEFEADMMHVG